MPSWPPTIEIVGYCVAGPSGLNTNLTELYSPVIPTAGGITRRGGEESPDVLTNRLTHRHAFPNPIPQSHQPAVTNFPYECFSTKERIVMNRLPLLRYYLILLMAVAASVPALAQQGTIVAIDSSLHLFVTENPVSFDTVVFSISFDRGSDPFRIEPGGDVIMPYPGDTITYGIDTQSDDEAENAASEAAQPAESEHQSTDIRNSDPTIDGIAYDGGPWEFDSTINIEYSANGGGDVLMPDPGDETNRHLYGDDHTREQLDVRVLANPFTDRLQVSIAGAGNQALHIEVVSPFGGTVYSGEATQSIELPASGWPKGNYILYIRSANGGISTTNVLKR